MVSSRHKVSCGRIVGRAHAITQTPCQDFVAGRNSSLMACIALADGAGSRPRSEIGAEAVVRASLRMLLTQFDQVYNMCERSPNLARRHIHERLMSVLVREASRHKCEVDALASTLLFVAYKGGRFVAAHVGDGVIVQVDEHGIAKTFSHPENGEYANTTVFVTDPKSMERLRLFHGDAASSLAGFALMSDGCAESLYDKKTGQPAAAVGKLLLWNREFSKKKMKSILGINMEQAFSKKSADDCSLALMSIT